MLSALAVFVLMAPLGPKAPTQASPPGGAADAFRFDLLKYRDRVEGDGSQVRTLEVRVRLGTAQGVAQFGQIGLPYVDGLGEVRFDDVVIEKADGRKVEVENGLIEDLNPLGVSGTSLPADVRFKKLTIPGLEPGDRLSYRITNRQKPLAPGRAFGEFKFSPIETSSQTYELDLPRESTLRVHLRKGSGVEWEEVASAADRRVRRLVVAPPAPGGRKPTKDELQARIEPDVSFTSFKDWTEVAHWWSDISRDRMKPEASVAAEAASLIKTGASPKDKAATLHAFITSRIRYINVSFGLGRMQPRPAADVLAKRYGDCKDKHALLAALAASAGLDVRPVLVNSARADLLDDVPGPHQFDHMISVVRLGPSPEEWLWLDGTNPFAGPGHLLPPLRDKRALLIEASGDGLLVRTPKDPPFRPRQEMALKASLAPDGVMRGHASWLMRSDAEVQLRAAFSAIPRESLTSAFQEVLASGWKESTVKNVTVSDPLETASPFRVEFDLETKVPSKGSERSLPMPFLEVGLPEPADPATAGEPLVTFELRDMSARAEVEIPEGDRAQAPLSVSLERPFGAFRSAYSVEGQTLRLERTLTLSQASLPAGDGAAYRSFREAINTDRDQEFSITLAAPGPAAAGGGAEELRTEGLAALKKKDFAKAVALLQKATEADPGSMVAFEDLGRALHDLGRTEDAVAAFTRQIENAPFHESAYSWRAYVLGRMNRWAEAEKDLLKQIEVAPFKPWSYEKLGDRRFQQKKYGEAADYYARAAAIEPKVAKRWLDLGVAQARAGREADARGSLDRAISLDPQDWLKVTAAAAYHSLGDPARAGQLAQDALPSLSRKSVEITPDELGEDDLYWGERLVEAWRLVGAAALAAQDLTRAEAYLQAAWLLAFSPEAGWALGELRERQGRLADAVELWSMASAVPTASAVLPEDRETRIEAACKKLPTAAPVALVSEESPSAITVRSSICHLGGGDRLTRLRTVALSGPPLADLTEEVLLLADAEGRVERVQNLSRKKPEAFERQLARLGPVRLSPAKPGDAEHKSVRRGLFVCTAAAGCMIILDMPGLAGLREIEGEGQRSIRITKLEPRAGTILRRGQQVTVTATVHCETRADYGFVELVVQDQAMNSLATTRLVETVPGGSGEVTFVGTFTVPADATRVDVFLPLNGPKRGATSIVGGATYPVH